MVNLNKQTGALDMRREINFATLYDHLIVNIHIKKRYVHLITYKNSHNYI